MRKFKVTKLEIAEKVKNAQAAIDVFAPGKVVVRSTSEDGEMFMIGDYMYRKEYTLSSSERLDKYYDAGIFVGFFKQRADWLNASLEAKEQCTTDGTHPSEYREKV